MRKFIHNKKHIVITLLLILTISNFGMAFGYWASAILGDQENLSLSIPLGDWDFEDTDLVVATYRSDHAVVLALTVGTVSISDKTAVETALAVYGLLSEDAKAELAVEEALLISLFNQIIALENSEFLDFEANAYDSGLTGTVDINGRTWYADNVYISNDPTYDVWRDTRALSLGNNAYFESQDLFINGIDKITLYHGALNYVIGSSLQFKVEYELASNPGVWVALIVDGSNVINIESDTLSTFTEIEVNQTVALNIRFTAIIGSAGDYICLDDITIYEHTVSSALEATTFRTIYAGALALDIASVEITDKSAVEQALAAYDLLSVEAKAELVTEKALLDSLLVEINLQVDILAAEALVAIAENSFLQIDLDNAQVLVTALPNGTEKTALQVRLDQVQNIIDEIVSFQSNHTLALALTVGIVTPSDQPIVEAALTAYELLSVEAKAALTAEKALLDSLMTEINNQIPTGTQVAQFQSNHAVVLALTVGTVTISDKAGVEQALAAYELLSVDAKAALTAEKTLLDSLLVEINLQEDILAAEALVAIAENSILQIDVDNAQVLVTALPNGTEKTALQDRLNQVQSIIDEIVNFQSNHAVVLALTVGTVSINDKLAVETALAVYGLLSEDAKAELAVEEALLISLFNQIIALENSEFLDFEANAYDSGLTGTVDINGRTWYADNVYISNDPTYDVWRDTRALSLGNNAYFESQDLFINGIDKITLYHGALNYVIGSSLQFKVEYELASNPGVWVALIVDGSNVINIESDTLSTFTEIEVNQTVALNIRFTAIIGSAGDYICLDDITIYEHTVSSALEATTFRTIYAGALALDIASVEITDKSAVEQALAAYDLLSVEAKAELVTEKALLDSLLVEINLQVDILAAEALVAIAENSFLQIDLDNAQVLVTALPNGTEKTALQVRLNQVQNIIDEIVSFQSNHTLALALTVGIVTPSDQPIVEAALTAYELLSVEAKVALTAEKALLDSLMTEINNQIPTGTQVAQFQSNHAVVLALTVGTVTISDKAGVEQALAAYELLSVDAKAALTAEKTLLDSLLVEIDLQVDILAATTVDNLITALPGVGGVVLADQTQIEAARTAYNALTASQQSLVINEAILTSIEAELIALQTATASVVIAEASNLQADVDSAQILVNVLASGLAKTALQDRLDAVQDIIDVEAAKLLIINYFNSNSVVVSKLNNATAIKETAFISKANEAVIGLDVVISITNTNEVDRRNTTYTIVITKNAASVTIDVDVSFTR